MISKGERAANYLILAAFAAFALWPVLTIVAAALGPDDSAARTAQGPGLLGLHPENFGTAWQQGQFGHSMLTSIAVSAFVVTCATLLSVMSGYAFGTMTFPGRNLLFYVFLVGIMVPAEATVVPLYFDLRTLGLTNTFWAIALPQVAQSVAFGTFWMRTYFRASPVAMAEAARLDGAGSWTTLWRILLPIGRPAVTTLVVLTFMWTWNEFLIPLVMATSDELRTAPLGLAFFQGQYTSGFTLLAAGAVIVAAPVVVLYLFLQRRFIQGMIEGAVRE
ncbi:carbohydrate ABC transporter membrane protein 2, CUT1 family [Micromonospora rhizosphaerae]|uniref:Carbohydrate ABC transporter membrane protein 2, CUT1 family n=1 Tax=Micromonospora rhizosphaerae TaxID=568872 RepID=A0A1C6SZN4_9ACTN|nr:carbohydrate ABC transporter permease [Micromonospora rhizosphaerae]SCL34802.1 carbohydrate ABC transporter membrane protein 2, CUT1 family [Micromonospora rhizosphaerae]